MGRLLLIINPRAGKAQVKFHLLGIIDIFIKAGWQVEVHITQAPLDAMEIARTKGSQADLVVCSGGPMPDGWRC